ncbi:ribosomal-processing cysteine protease Prp [Vagococcus sp. JNUCC 83]
MIRAEFKQAGNGDFLSFEMDGHAESGPFGYDIVCAAASALSINTINSINELAEYMPIYEMESGYLYFERLNDLSDRQIDITNLLVHSLLIGLRSIEADNQAFIQVKLSQGGASPC